jgi:acetaldehyde dehydrogenase/alcohol dehydrogenase
VRAAYRSGKPAIGVGAGNTPAIIAASADVAQAVRSILTSKLFDNGLICASEQSVIVERDIYETVKAMFQANGGYLLSREETDRLRRLIGTDGRVNPRIVGQTAIRIAEMAGIDPPAEKNLLVAEVDAIGPTEPLSHEKLAPVLAMYRADDFTDALGKASGIVGHGGQGHTASLHVDPGESEKIRCFTQRIKAARLLLNCPSSHGAIGGIYNRKLDPSLTLGCGSWGGSSICENLGVKHLLNTKMLVERRESEESRLRLRFDRRLIRAMRAS